jgi:acid phosphatase (class A)
MKRFNSDPSLKAIDSKDCNASSRHWSRSSWAESQTPSNRTRHLISIWLVLYCLVAPLFAAETYLAPGQPDGIALLPPPPAPNSPEQAADLASASNVFQAAQAKEKERAEKFATLTIFKFAPAIGDFFRPGEFSKTEALFENVKASIREPLNAAKNHWRRPRPYQLDAALKYGKSEPSFSYPSGHSTVGTVQALILADLFPEHRQAILKIGRQIGWDRVIIGKHFPTDIYAGRTLAQAIVRELKANPEFQHDLAEAKAEVEGAQTTQSPAK